MIGKLKLISEKAKQDKKMKFTSLVHLINEENLAQCYKELKRDRACGIDGVTVEEYGQELEENLKSLVDRMKSKSYRPQPVRRVYIPKPGKDEKRPLGIPSVEDKLVQIMAKKILEAIYEQDFLESSYGYRPGRSTHTAINRLDKVVMTKPIKTIVEVDIKKFFDEVKHYWVNKGVEERVSDPNFLWLIRRFLKAGTMEEGQYTASEMGTPQGGVISPVLANIYLHYALDQWFEIGFKSSAKGYAELIRYADDVVAAFEHKEDAERFMKELEERLNEFGLRVNKEKTRMVEFGKEVWEQREANQKKTGTFDFLGFTHYGKASRRGKFIMGHKTAKKKLAMSIMQTKEWLKKIRNKCRMKEWWLTLIAKLRGHYNYYGISGNMQCLRQFYSRVIMMVYKWINRRSQRKSMSWERYLGYLRLYPLPTPKIYHNLYTLRPIY
jgi:group II intron reverse transcriptase/maturase